VGVGEDSCKTQAAVGWPPPLRNLDSLIHRSSSKREDATKHRARVD
jgi:hypothetical protein